MNAGQLADHMAAQIESLFAVLKANDHKSWLAAIAAHDGCTPGTR